MAWRLRRLEASRSAAKIMDAFHDSLGHETNMARHTRIAGYAVLCLMLFTLLVEIL